MTRASEVFDGPTITVEDTRKDYGEIRYATVGYLDGRMVFFAWTERSGLCRIISMRKANAREQREFGPRLRQ